MASETFYGHDGDVLLCKSQFDYFKSLIDFMTEHPDIKKQYKLWSEKK